MSVCTGACLSAPELYRLHLLLCKFVHVFVSGSADWSKFEFCYIWNIPGNNQSSGSSVNLIFTQNFREAMCLVWTVFCSGLKRAAVNVVLKLNRVQVWETCGSLGGLVVTVITTSLVRSEQKALLHVLSFVLFISYHLFKKQNEQKKALKILENSKKKIFTVAWMIKLFFIDQITKSTKNRLDC